MSDTNILLMQIRALEADLAAKDKRIEELEQDNRKEWLIGYAEAHDVDHDEYYVFHKDAINEAWRGRNIAYDSAATPSEIIEDALAELGIKLCPKCGGTKIVWERRIDKRPERGRDCDCPNNGWVIEKGGSVG